MSPRAACRLETLGFTEVYDYVAGKVDWRAHNLPVEGEQADLVTAGRLARDDVVTCGLGDTVGQVREWIADSPYGFALVVADDVLLGRLRGSALDCDPGLRAEELMEPGPSTTRPDTEAAALAKRLAEERNLRWAIISDPEGRLIGVASREDLELEL